MAYQKRLSNKKDMVVAVVPPISDEELVERHLNYHALPPNKFAFAFREQLHRPATIFWNGQRYEIQFNHCINPFCKWYALPQKKYDDLKSKPSRYKLTSPSRKGETPVKQIKCNSVPSSERGLSLDCKTTALSNWSIADEISRLIRINTIQDEEPRYTFHKGECPIKDQTPFVNTASFYKQGKSSSTGKQMYQCKTCKKKTTLKPNRDESITYKQKRSDILHALAKQLLNKTPVNRTCEILGISKGTYYDKLEILYKKCLEFIERHETKKLSNMTFKEMWLNTDQMMYYLSNERKKGMAANAFGSNDPLNFQTRIIVTSDVHSRYVFRSDVAFDYDIILSEIEADTLLFRSDHLNDFNKKYARIIRRTDFPQPPSKNDTQTQEDYHFDLKTLDVRGKYIDGLHISSTYTSIAHFWLIKQAIKASEWRFVTDEDRSLTSAIFRVFGKEVKLSDAHHFLCQTNKSARGSHAIEEYEHAKEDLLSWGFARGYDTTDLPTLALYQLKELFETHKFHNVKHTANGSYNVYADNPIHHPLASEDRGYRWVDCTTDLSSLEPIDIAKLILNVNDHSTNAFIQILRRRVSILERPLLGAKNEKKSYMYANTNPKYAQMAVTVFRTFYNFCLPYKTKDGISKTPAQRLGITNKQFELKDIIYLR